MRQLTTSHSSGKPLLGRNTQKIRQKSSRGRALLELGKAKGDGRGAMPKHLGASPYHVGLMVDRVLRGLLSEKEAYQWSFENNAQFEFRFQLEEERQKRKPSYQRELESYIDAVCDGRMTIASALSAAELVLEYSLEPYDAHKKLKEFSEAIS